jgi:Holliday junction resolvasome RuvABC endonuclease subunit
VCVIGVDPSLTATGISDGVRHETIRTESCDTLQKRCSDLCASIMGFVFSVEREDREELLVIEAPMLRAIGHGGSHLYEVGWIMAHLYLFADESEIRIIEISNASLKKWAFGKGNLDKAHVALACYKKWNVEFTGDRGVDQAHAYMLHKYGCAVVAGEIEHHAAAERGSGKRAKATVRKRRREAHAA